MTTRTDSRPVTGREPGANPSRAFGILDELACYFDSPAEPINVHVELWLPGRIDAERLREAVTAMLAGQPRARARRAAGGWWRRGYTWEIPADADLDPVSTTSWRTEAELDSARARFMAAAPSVDHSPPFRLLLASGPGRDSLILNAHHVAFDGRSCLRLLRLLADEYSTREAQRPPRRADGGRPVPHARQPASHPSQPPSHANEPAPPGNRNRPSVRFPARIAPQHAAGRRPRRAPGYGFGLLGWPGVPSVPPPAGGEGPQVTVNDLLIAALIQTIMRWNAARHRRPRPVRISMPADARLPGGEDELGNVSRLCRVTADPPGSAGLTGVVASQTWRAKRQAGPKVDAALAAVAGMPLPASVKRRLVRLAVRWLGGLECDTSLLSNLGNMTDPPRFGRLTPTRIWFSTSAHMPRGLSVGAVTIEGRLQLCFRYRYALLDDDAGRDFATEYAEALSALAGTGTEI